MKREINFNKENLTIQPLDYGTHDYTVKIGRKKHELRIIRNVGGATLVFDNISVYVNPFAIITRDFLENIEKISNAYYVCSCYSKILSFKRGG